MLRNSVEGIVLLVVLIFLYLFSLLSLLNLTNNIYLFKSQVKSWQEQQFSLKVDHILKIVEKEIAPKCTIPITSPLVLKNKPLSFWKSVACHGNFAQISYDYVHELLGIDYCGYVYNAHKNQADAPKYQRITLTLGGHKLWQSTIATSSKVAPICATKLHEVMLGLQMRRQL